MCIIIITNGWTASTWTTLGTFKLAVCAHCRLSLSAHEANLSGTARTGQPVALAFVSQPETADSFSISVFKWCRTQRYISIMYEYIRYCWVLASVSFKATIEKKTHPVLLYPFGVILYIFTPMCIGYVAIVPASVPRSINSASHTWLAHIIARWIDGWCVLIHRRSCVCLRAPFLRCHGKCGPRTIKIALSRCGVVEHTLSARLPLLVALPKHRESLGRHRCAVADNKSKFSSTPCFRLLVV